MSFMVFRWVAASRAYFSLTRADTYSFGLDSEAISPLAPSFNSVEDMVFGERWYTDEHYRATRPNNTVEFNVGVTGFRLNGVPCLHTRVRRSGGGSRSAASNCVTKRCKVYSAK